jgi:uridine kinase
MLERASSRDVAWIGSVELVRERSLTGWIPRHKWYEETLRPRELADIMVDNQDIEHPLVIRAHERWNGRASARRTTAVR